MMKHSEIHQNMILLIETSQYWWCQKYSTNNFESQILQIHEKDKTKAEVSLSVLYSRKTDENMNIQKMKNSIKKIFWSYSFWHL